MTGPVGRLVLYHAPGSSSRVALNALEEVGLDFEDRGIALMRGEQRAAAYRAINPHGKVPALVIDGEILTETPAIVFHLAIEYPAADLLPRLDEPIARARALSDLVWCASALHPLVRQAALPQLFTSGDAAAVRAHAIQALEPIVLVLSERVAGGAWWYGPHWSIVDVYLSWLVGMAKLGGALTDPATALHEHTARVRARPSFQRALARERAALERHDIRMPPGTSL